MHEHVRQAADILTRGGVVAFPTDTFYGLAVDPRNPDAVGLLFSLKGRDAGKASPLIAASTEQAEQAVVFDSRALKLARLFWPGPLSLILPARPEICRAVLAGGTTAAIRVPADETARDLATAVGYCITATSANVSGNPPARTVAEIDDAIRERADMVLDGGEVPGGSPSTIVDLCGDAPRLVRAGAIAWERVLESLE